MTNGLTHLLVEERMNGRLREADHARLARLAIEAAKVSGSPRETWRGMIATTLSAAAAVLDSAARLVATRRTPPAGAGIGESRSGTREPCA